MDTPAVIFRKPEPNIDWIQHADRKLAEVWTNPHCALSPDMVSPIGFQTSMAINNPYPLPVFSMYPFTPENHANDPKKIQK